MRTQTIFTAYVLIRDMIAAGYDQPSIGKYVGLPYEEWKRRSRQSIRFQDRIDRELARLDQLDESARLIARLDPQPQPNDRSQNRDIGIRPDPSDPHLTRK